MIDPTDNHGDITMPEQTAVLLESLAAGSTSDLIEGQFLITLGLSVTGKDGDPVHQPWVAMTAAQARLMIRSLAHALVRAAALQAKNPAAKPASRRISHFAN